MQEIIDLVNQYGVPTVVAVGMAYFIYYIWKFVTTQIHMIRLDQKINTILELQKQEKEKDKK